LARILIFDSGVGGLSLLPALRDALPAARQLYVSDNAFFPYGVRPGEAVVARVEHVLTTLQPALDPDLVVVACNTASTVALPALRSRLPVPVVGVVPAIKPAASLTRTGCIALLATPATVARPYTQTLIEQFAPHCEVIRLGCSELVELAERKLRGQRVDPQQLISLLDPLLRHPRAAEVDTIVLGCTHFPLLQPELAAAFARPVAWLDSSTAIARRAASLLAPTPHRHDDDEEFAVFTAASQDLEALAPALRARGFTRMQVVPL
jgi:glutamate racemase